MAIGRTTPTNHKPRDLALLELSREGWSNHTRTDGITTTWLVVIKPDEVREVQEAFPHLDVQVGNFIVTYDSDDQWDVISFADEAMARRVFGTP